MQDRAETVVTLAVTPKYESDERLDDVSRALQAELRELGLRSKPSPVHDNPAGAKGDPFTVGALALAVAPALLPKLVEYLRDWTLRSKEVVSTVSLKANVEGKVLELQYPSNAPPSPETIAAYLDALNGPKRS